MTAIRSRTRLIRWNLALLALLGLQGLAAPAPNAAQAPREAADQPPDEAAVAAGLAIEDLLAYSFPSTLVASPVGSKVAWSANTQGRHSIWVAEGDELLPRQLYSTESDDGRPWSVIGFTADGETLVYRRAAEFNPDQDPLGSGGTAIYALDVASGSVDPAEVGPRLLVRADNAVLSPVGRELFFLQGTELHRIEIPRADSTAMESAQSPDETDPGREELDDGEQPVEAELLLSVRGSVRDLSFSPDGSRLLFSLARESAGDRYAFIAVFDRQSSELRYLDAGVDFDTGPRFSPDGTRVAFLRRTTEGQGWVLSATDYPKPDPWMIRVVDLQSGAAHDALREPEPWTFTQAALEWIDDENLIFLSERDGWRRLYQVRARGGRPRARSGPGAEIEDLRVFGSAAYCVTNEGGVDRRQLLRIDPERSELLTTGDIAWSPVVTADGAQLAYLRSTAVDPADVWTQPLGASGGDEQTSRARPIVASAHSERFPRARLTEPEPILLHASDGVEVHAQLFRPPESFTGRRPAVLYFHGGPIRQMLLGWHYSPYYHACYAFHQYLASRGYVVLSVNYRLGIGYGREFRDVADGGPRGASEYRDVLAAAAWLRTRSDVDPGRIGVWGGSYGGLLTALALARNSDLFAAGVDLHGVHDWNLWQGWVSHTEVQDARTPWHSSPVASAESWTSPVLLIHGDDDRNVAFAETLRMVRSLRERGVEHELLVLPDEVHSFLRHANWVEVFRHAGDFFDRRLRDKLSPYSPLPRGSARRELELGGSRLELFTYKPESYRGERLLFVHHGTLRNADEYRDHAQSMAERFGALVVAPRFDAARFPVSDYQFGGLLDASGEAREPKDWTFALIPRIAREVGRAEGTETLPYWLIGHSAGGQFVERMAAFVELEAERVVAANPGSHVFPTLELPFGYGFGELPRSLAGEERLRHYLAAPLTIYLGTADDHADQYFPSGPHAMAQGASRLERGRNCYRAAEELARQNGWAFGWQLVEAEGVAHDHEAMFDHPACERALFGERAR